jgi:hypothetical protein
LKQVSRWAARNRCLLCNEEVEFQDHGVHLATAPAGSEVLVCSVHSDCLRTLVPERNLVERQSGSGWSCVICGEPSDTSRGVAVLTEFRHLGEARTGRAPIHFAHASCVRNQGHTDYRVPVLKGAKHEGDDDH